MVYHHCLTASMKPRKPIAPNPAQRLEQAPNCQSRRQDLHLRYLRPKRSALLLSYATKRTVTESA